MTYQSFLGLSMTDAMALADSYGMEYEFHAEEAMTDWVEPAWIELEGDGSCGSCALYFEGGLCVEFERLAWL